ncbi:hypothetical protein E2C01_005089 [Portunus trituberculatus]|uniref:Uncharacterized protein n=1 Tax=Portunus trituberculatus TaxID=210409 RepID=A0A5B7CSE9_PORTR|nr:hypothetical protein [Portunus trituberculatus]
MVLPSVNSTTLNKSQAVTVTIPCDLVTLRLHVTKEVKNRYPSYLSTTTWSSTTAFFIRFVYD